MIIIENIFLKKLETIISEKIDLKKNKLAFEKKKKRAEKIKNSNY